jgi:RNA polymerase sigma-70 factor (ECF subfamily)
MGGSKDTIYAQLLALRCRQGDMGAFEQLVRLWEARLFYYIRRLVDQEADAWDVLQKTWIKALRGIRSLKDPKALPCWLYTLARRTVIDHSRRASDRPLPEDFADESADPSSADEPGLALDNAEAVHRALAGLSPPHREVLTLFFLQDLTLEEIAAVLDVPVGTVKSRLHYARRAARAAVHEEGHS